MKIGITGTHGVGKTSLAHSLVGTLKEKGSHAVVSSEHERQCPLPAGTEERNSLDAQVWIIGRQFIEEVELSAKYPVVVCDRTMLCNYAYFLWNLNKMPKLKNNPMVKVVHDMVDKWVHTYDYLFRIPISNQTTLMKDGFRSTTTNWQKEIDEIIDKIIEEKKLKTFTIPLDTNERRVKAVLDILKI
jgi:nicotinamide riboside kinase